VHPFEGAIELLRLLKGKDVLIGVIDVASDTVETAAEVADTIARAAKYVPKKHLYPAPTAAWRRWTARSRCGSSKRWSPEPASPGKAQIEARHGMVACPHAAASEAGVAVLRSGGSAVDAAIAAASTLASSIRTCAHRGDAFWLIYDASQRQVSYLDGGGRAAASATLARFAGQREIPFRGVVPATLTTPGAVASFCEAHARFADCRSHAACRTRSITHATAIR